MANNLCNDTEAIAIFIEINKFLPQVIEHLQYRSDPSIIFSKYNFDEKRCDDEKYNNMIKQLQKHFKEATEEKSVHSRTLGDNMSHIGALILVMYDLDLFQFAIIDSDESHESNDLDENTNNLFNIILDLYKLYKSYKKTGLDFQEFIDTTYPLISKPLSISTVTNNVLKFFGLRKKYYKEKDIYKYKYLKYKQKYLQLKNN